MTKKEVKEFLELYYKVHCRLVVPFPRLTAYRQGPITPLGCPDEYAAHLKEERIYNEKHLKNVEKLTRLTNDLLTRGAFKE